MSYCKPSLVRVGSYIYLALNNFIGSWPRLVLEGTLSLPVPLSLPKREIQDSLNNVALKRTFSFMGLLDTTQSFFFLGVLDSFRV